MSMTWRDGSIFARGVALGAVACTFVVAMNWPSTPPKGQDGVEAQRVAAARPRAACPQAPAIEAAGASDGRFNMPTRLASYGPSDVGAFMAVGKEAAAAGRARDAEVAFLMACRVADRFRGSDSVEAGHARRQLALHYDDLIHDASPTALVNHDELLARVQLLQPEGPAPAAPPPRERPVQVATAQPAAPAPTPSVSAAPAPAAQTLPVASVVPAAPPAATPAPPLPQVTPLSPLALPHSAQPHQAKAPPRRIEVARVVSRPLPQPSRAVALSPAAAGAGCVKARSASERIICSDARLAQLDRELGYLQARARMSTRNAWAFNRRSEEEWQRREATCRDRDCLLRWYTQRRHQLQSEIESG